MASGLILPPDELQRRLAGEEDDAVDLRRAERQEPVSAGDRGESPPPLRRIHTDLRELEELEGERTPPSVALRRQLARTAIAGDIPAAPGAERIRSRFAPLEAPPPRFEDRPRPYRLATEAAQQPHAPSPATGALIPDFYGAPGASAIEELKPPPTLPRSPAPSRSNERPPQPPTVLKVPRRSIFELLDPALVHPHGGERRAFRHIAVDTVAKLPIPRQIGTAVLAYVTGADQWYYCDGIAWLLLSVGSPIGSPIADAHVWDEFMGGNQTSGQIGALGWNFSQGSFSSIDSELGHPGILRRTSAAVTGNLAYFWQWSSQTTGVFDADEKFDLSWIIRPQETTNVTVRFGAMLQPSQDAPNDGCYFEKLNTDTNWFAVTRAGGVETRTDIGVAYGNAWFWLRVKRNAASIEFYVDGVLKATHTTNIPTGQIVGANQIKPSENVAKSVDMDYFSLRVLGTGRGDDGYSADGFSHHNENHNTRHAGAADSIYIMHIAEFWARAEDLATGVLFPPPGRPLGETGDHGDYTAIRGKAFCGTAGTGTNTLLIEADDGPGFATPTVLYTLQLSTATEVDDVNLDNAWAAGDNFIRARCTAVGATVPKDVGVQFYYLQRVRV